MDTTRVTDYLDDKLQALADLEQLDNLLATIRQQQDLLKQQLDEARQDHTAARDKADTHREQIKQDALTFQQEQEKIDTELLIVTQSDASEDAAEKFQSSMARLEKLDIAVGYVELLKDVDALKADSLALLDRSDDAALMPYRKLQRLVITLQPLQEAAEGAAPHLLDYISHTVADLQQTIQASYSKNLEDSLKKMNWPKVTTAVPLALLEAWTVNVGRLLDLQLPTLESEGYLVNSDQEPAVLLPLQVLVHELEQRFSYHFTGNKPTNRLDKPEYFLSHVTDLIREYSPFVQENIQPLLLRHFRSHDVLFTVPAYIDATTALITAALPMLRRKLSSVATQVKNQPALLSHLVQEVISFDTQLQEQYSYAPRSAADSDPGLSYYLLTTCGHFDIWLAGEKEFALRRYHAIVDAPDAGQLDYDAVASPNVPKPTTAAVRVNDLLDTITARYRSLSNFAQKVQFLISIQIEIFDMFYRRLNDGLSAYLTATSSLARTMHTLAKEDQGVDLSGTKGLERLCRILGAADYLERAMGDWSEDVFFVELWVELDWRASAGGNSGRGEREWREIREKTSSAFVQENGDGTDTFSNNNSTTKNGPMTSSSSSNTRIQGALFDETASSYRRLRVRTENTLIETLSQSLAQSLRPYTALTTWSSLSSSSSSSTITPDLDPTLRLLDSSLSFLLRALGRPALRRIARSLCAAMGNAIWNGVLAHSRAAFSTAGVAQLGCDLRALGEVVERWAGRGSSVGGLRRVVEGTRLVGLPVGRAGGGDDAGKKAEGEGDEEDDDDGAWDVDGGEGALDGEMDGNGERKVGQEEGLTLFQVERLVFRDNAGAREALDRLGLDALTEAEARMLLLKRVELRS